MSSVESASQLSLAGTTLKSSAGSGSLQVVREGSVSRIRERLPADFCGGSSMPSSLLMASLGVLHLLSTNSTFEILYPTRIPLRGRAQLIAPAGAGRAIRDPSTPFSARRPAVL